MSTRRPSLRIDRALRALALAAMATLGTSCAIVSYRHPDAPTERPAPRGDALYYRVQPLQGISMGGMDELKRSMKKNDVFAAAELVDEPTARGVCVDVHALWVPPSIGALAYGYVDLSLLAALPLYSDSMGYDVQYTVYVDGRKIRLYEYPIRRRVFMWLPLLPFAWVNLLTENETDAFSAVTRRFFFEASRDGAFDGRGALPPPAPARASQPAS
jgi:hypothetical protein